MAVTYVFDIDGTICTDRYGVYEDCTPVSSVIEDMHNIYAEGNAIVLHTARSEKHRQFTLWQLGKWGVPYDELIMGKPKGDYYVDTNALRPEEL